MKAAVPALPPHHAQAARYSRDSSAHSHTCCGRSPAVAAAVVRAGARAEPSSSAPTVAPCSKGREVVDASGQCQRERVEQL